MKTFLATILSMSMMFCLTSFNVKANNQEEIKFHTTNSKSIDYDKQPLAETMEINGSDKTVYFTSTEGYYYDNGQKIVIIYIDDSIFVENPLYDAMNRGASMNQFLADFYYTGTFKPKTMKVSSNFLKVTMALLTQAIAEMALAALNLPPTYSNYLYSSAQIIAAAIKDNPPKYPIRLNIKEYKNNRCLMYLTGKTFNMIANGKLTPRMYYYSWSENPSLGVMDTNCKVASQTYPYASGFGE